MHFLNEVKHMKKIGSLKRSKHTHLDLCPQRDEASLDLKDHQVSSRRTDLYYITLPGLDWQFNVGYHTNHFGDRNHLSTHRIAKLAIIAKLNWNEGISSLQERNVWMFLVAAAPFENTNKNSNT